MNNKTVLISSLASWILLGCAGTGINGSSIPTTSIELEQRIEKIERITQNSGLLNLSLRLDELEMQINELQGQLEQLSYLEQKNLDTQRSRYIDLDDRIQDLERTISAMISLNSLNRDQNLVVVGLPVPNGTDNDNYQAAFDFLKNEKYDSAALAFQQFLVVFPESQLADNAQYWLAESYYAGEQFEIALEQFSIVTNKYPRSRKVPDAMLKIGYCYYEISNYENAIKYLNQVIEDFPDTSHARNAGQRLKIINEINR